MKKFLLIGYIALFSIVFWISSNAYAEEIAEEESFFNSSLHYTTRGMSYWYDKSRGGLETLTGIPYTSTKLDCLNCHVSSCDRCHKTEVDRKLYYSTKTAQNQDVCLSCHKREKAIKQIDVTANQQDVHFAKGMQCMSCHSARDVHGDGTEYSSMKQSGAIDASCEKCHSSVNPTTSHKIHRDKLECKACHVRHVVSCSNCHIGALINDRKRVDIKLSGWIFLMNYNGKVTSANMQNFVVPDNKTFLIFAPQNSHSIMKEGRKCGDCHGTDNVRHVQSGNIRLTWLEDGEVKHVKGVIPVVEDVKYECIYQNYKDGKWIPIENPTEPGLQYAGFGTPLTKGQLKKLSMPMGR